MAGGGDCSFLKGNRRSSESGEKGGNEREWGGNVSRGGCSLDFCIREE